VQSTLTEDDTRTRHNGPNDTKVFTRKEKLLLPAALLIAVLCERLVFNIQSSNNLVLGYGLFWLAYLIIFCAVYWKKLKNNRVLWYVGCCAALLCVWNIMQSWSYMGTEYAVLNFAVIPAVLMAHAQLLAGGYALKDVKGLVLGWISGWLIKPFSGIPVLFAVLKPFFKIKGKLTAQTASRLQKVLIGVCVTVPLLFIIVPLLGSADLAFGYYLNDFISRFIGFKIDASVIIRIFLVLMFFMFFYSFLWNVGFGKNEWVEAKSHFQIDAIITGIVLGTVTVIYVLFCAFQFTYLFAGEGLPGDMTYSEYAREGFWQTVAVCAINLFMFGMFLNYCKKSKVISALLALLLVLTGIMLVSGSVRLSLYIGAYGLTWLRVWSAWFVIYLIAVVVVCAVRMLRERTPAIALCMLILLGWYVALGYVNPAGMAEKYNTYYGFDQTE
jgi:hypothetical protein